MGDCVGPNCFTRIRSSPELSFDLQQCPRRTIDFGGFRLASADAAHDWIGCAVALVDSGGGSKNARRTGCDDLGGGGRKYADFSEFGCDACDEENAIERSCGSNWDYRAESVNFEDQ